MKAIVGDSYGSKDVLRLRETDNPEVLDDEELVRGTPRGRGAWRLPGSRRVLQVGGTWRAYVKTPP